MNLIKSSILWIALATSVGCSDPKQNTQHQQDKSTENRDGIEDNQHIDPNSEEYLNLLNIQTRAKVVSISPKTYESDFIHSQKDLLTGKNLLRRPKHSLKERENIINERMLNILRKHDLKWYPQSMTVMTDIDGTEFGKYIDIIPKNPRSNCTNAVRQISSKYNADNIPDDSFKYPVSFNQFTSSEAKRSVIMMRQIRNNVKKLITSGVCNTNDIKITEGDHDYFSYPNNVVTYLMPDIEGVVIQDMQKLIKTLEKEDIAEGGDITEKDILVRPSNIFYNPEKAITTDVIVQSPEGKTVTAKRMKR